MTDNSSTFLLSRDEFKAHFAAIVPLILEEWPDVPPTILHNSEGEFDRVVTCIALSTEHTRSLIRRQLRELYLLAVAQPSHRQPQLDRGPLQPQSSGSDLPQRQSSRLMERLTQLTSHPPTDADLKETIALLEERTEELLAQFKQEVLPDLKEKAKQNIGGSLITALGIGFIVGLIVGGGRGR